MGEMHEILLLSDDSSWCDWCRGELESEGHVHGSLKGWEAEGTNVPQLIVTDRLPITEPLGEIGAVASRGEVAVVGVGTEGSADVLLPADCIGRELRLACRLTAEIVRLRRQLAKEQNDQRALKRMAYRDPLTGLANRRQWDQELVKRLEGLRKASGDSMAGLGVVLLDVDRFKRLNDERGHAVGDTTLQRVAQKLIANLARQHLAARVGGDEFGILFADIFPPELSEMADRVRRSVETPLDEHQDAPGVTTSAGAVCVNSHDVVRPLQVLHAASQALRSAKQQGRNRTVTGSLD